MRAVVLRGGALVVDDVPDPEPKPGQLLVRTLACGICGSDLHAAAHGPELIAGSHEVAADDPLGVPMEIMDLGRDVILGHEFCGEVLEAADGFAAGATVVALPYTFDETGVHQIGFSNEYPGGYSELHLQQSMMATVVPNGLAAEAAVLTEPMAVGRHAVARGVVVSGDAAVVIGCGPVGLAVIADLKLRGAEPIVAADYSPTRRSLATAFGADEVVDPREEPVMNAWRRVDTRAAMRAPVVFECVGVPGMIKAAMASSPRLTRIVVVGVCMQPDAISPIVGIGRELELRFAYAYDPMEFAATLHDIAEGTLDVSPLVTGSVSLDGVPGAFADLADPEAHCKILVKP